MSLIDGLSKHELTMVLTVTAAKLGIETGEGPQTNTDQETEATSNEPKVSSESN